MLVVDVVDLVFELRSLLSLFQQIPDRIKSQIRHQQQSRRSQSSLSGVSKDFTDMFMNRHSVGASEEENNSFNLAENRTPRDPGLSAAAGKDKKLVLKSRLKKRTDLPSPFVKGFSLGYGAHPAPGHEDIEVGLRRMATGGGALENIKEEENYQMQDHAGNPTGGASALSPTSGNQAYQTAAQRSGRAK